MTKKQEQRKTQTEIPPLNGVDLLHLPDDFNYDFYRKFSKERDLRKWAFQFAKRQGIKEKTLGLETGGFSFNYTDLAGTFWKYGVFSDGNLDTHSGYEYLNDYHSYYLKEANGVFIPNEEKENDNLGVQLGKDGVQTKSDLLNYINNNKKTIRQSKEETQIAASKIKKISSTFSNPIQKANQILGGHGKTYFDDRATYDEYHKNVSSLYNKTASFLVNLEMPTDKIIKEIERRIVKLKKVKNLKEISITTKDNTFVYWAMGLACYDLIHDSNISQTKAYRKYLHFCLYGSQDNANECTDNQIFNSLETTYKQVVKMIDGGWKRLTGNP